MIWKDSIRDYLEVNIRADRRGGSKPVQLCISPFMRAGPGLRRKALQLHCTQCCEI
jgi:hypothetical protein